jgi:hypothetical protein
MNQKLQKIIVSEQLQDLVGKLVVVLGVVYLLLFCAESVLPGMVVEVFNINFLLLFLIATIFYFYWLDKQGKKLFQLRKVNKFVSYTVLIILFAVVVGTLLLVQYKISIKASIFFILIGAVMAKLFYEMFN